MPSFIGAVGPGARFDSSYIRRPQTTPTSPVARDQVEIGTKKMDAATPPTIDLGRAATMRAQQALAPRETMTAEPAVDAPTPQTVETAKPTVRGDANNDGKVSGHDARALFDYLFKGGPEPEGLARADRSGDGKLSLLDALKILEDVLNSEDPI